MTPLIFDIITNRETEAKLRNKKRRFISIYVDQIATIIKRSSLKIIQYQTKEQVSCSDGILFDELKHVWKGLFNKETGWYTSYTAYEINPLPDETIQAIEALTGVVFVDESTWIDLVPESQDGELSLMDDQSGRLSIIKPKKKKFLGIF